jgi:hypothetical protein
MRIYLTRWLARWMMVAGLTFMIWRVGFAQGVSCSKPIAPCKACHTSAAVMRELVGCMAQPWIIPPEAKEAKNPIPSSPKVLEEGKGLYKVNCEGCHGTQGGELGPIAMKFTIPVPNLSAPTVQAQTDGELFWKISNGKGIMPAWNTILTDEDCWKLVIFIRTFRNP